jgi:hypothetical protein
MNLALRDVRRHLGRFVGTAGGLGLLLTVVVAMQGIYAGMVDDATILTRAMRADLWIVQRDTRGPVRRGVAPGPQRPRPRGGGARRARARPTRISSSSASTLAASCASRWSAWAGPTIVGRACRWCAGGGSAQPHGELIVDASLGLAIGERLELADEPYAIVGLTRNALTSGGDSVAFVSVADAQLIALDQPAEATVLERQRVVERLRLTDLGRGQPALEDLATDPRWRAPALAAPPLAAVLVDVEPPAWPRCARSGAVGRRHGLRAGRGGGAVARRRGRARAPADRAVHGDPDRDRRGDRDDGHLQPDPREDPRPRGAQADGRAAPAPARPGAAAGVAGSARSATRWRSRSARWSTPGSRAGW